MRQVDVARRAGVGQATVSRPERGRLDSLSLRTIRRVCAAVDARFDGELVWRGGALDRLLDQRHAAIVAAVSETVLASGWRVQSEVTFSVFGERGSIDLLAMRETTRDVVVVEVKTELTSLEETLRHLDVKVRLSPRLCGDRFGWRPASVGRLLVLPEAGRNRRAIVRHEAILRPAFPQRGRAVREWLSRPSGPLNGLWLLSLSRRGALGQHPGGVDRVGRPRAGRRRA